MKTTARTLTKLFCISLVSMLPFLRGAGVCYSQNNSIVLDGAYIVLDGGTAANNIHVVVDQPNILGIIRLPSGGHIHSENQYNFITWLTSASTGNYLFPFGVGGTATDYIPFTFNKTAGNSNVSMSTWFTNQQNFPKPATTNVGSVTNMNGITDSVIYAIDRFWNIQAPSTTADLTFSYRGIENTTATPTNLVQAQHWNGASWDTPVGPGTTGATAGIATAGAFNGQNTFSPWVLITITTCTTDTLTQNPTICQGDSIVVGTSVYTTSGTFIDTLATTSGCDSIVTTNLTVTNTISSTDVQTACNSFTWINGINYTTSTNTPKDTLVSANGCDSIVTLNLTITNTVTSTDVQTACNSFTWINGINYTASTNTPKDTLVSANGCDSIVTLNLTINTFTTGTDVIISCTPIVWIDGNNYSTSTNTPTFTIANGAANGCDSIITLNLTINTPTKTTNVFNECEGFSVTVGTNTYTTTGIFIDIVNNCDTIETDLTINPAPQLTLIKADDNCGENIGSVVANVVSANPPITYTWNTGSTDSVISNLPVGTYSVIVNDGSGCVRADTVNVLDLQLDCGFFVYTPNAFTPNGDGNNDVFFVRGKGIEALSVKIYNRWGNKVFEINDVTQGWDGTYKGAEQNTAVFVFVLEATFLNGKTVTESGDVSLIR